MDGFGVSSQKEGNAIALAEKPNLDYIFNNYPYTTLGASGWDVGLPEGQMGNSEVGHLNFGAGRIVYQEITRIDKAISDGTFFKNQVLLESINKAKKNNSSLHLLGLVSDGCVHSSLNHLYALLKMAKENDVKNLFLHAFLDGRDTSPTSGIGYVEEVLNKFKELGIGELSTIVGRYYAMDRDKRWERVQKAYDCLVFGIGEKTQRPLEAIRNFYENKVTDEFMLPIVVNNSSDDSYGRIKNKHVGIFFNFRADRGRELSHVFTDENFSGFDRKTKLDFHLVNLTQYDEKLKCPVAFPQVKLSNILGEIISKHNLKQLRIAETEKYPHVTFFFNGGEEIPFPGEDRILVSSPKVATYDLKPEMSAYEVTDKVVEAILSKKYDFIVLNYANPDMVGHTGILEAAKKAIETVDKCVGKVFEAVQKVDGILMVTGDHGNAEQMIDPQTKEQFTAHTTDRVPFVLVGKNLKVKLREGGILADVAPTILYLMKIEKSKEMEGENLII